QPITTEIAPLTKFYPAEDYHQDYFRKNPNQPYCAYVISPKLQKLQKIKKEGFPAQKH
ncbi:MAG TPA: peptide-methionine (S)-S-oxide reductase, partial [Verrucomicrobiae bacterium]